MTEEHNIKIAKKTDLIGSIRIGLDESFKSLRESLTGLNDKDASAYPIDNRNNIAWIALHTMMNLDQHAYFSLYFLVNGGEDHKNMTINWDVYENLGWGDKPSRDYTYPPVSEILDLLGRIEKNVWKTFDQLSNEDMRKPIQDWFEFASDACMRTIWHTMAHVRQIWTLRGALGCADVENWPCQHWA